MGGNAHEFQQLAHGLATNDRVGVEKPEQLSVRDGRAGIHLPSATSTSREHQIGQRTRAGHRVVMAAAINNNDLRIRRGAAQLAQEFSDQSAFI